ncbi:MAG: 3-dehydroquinate synthase [Lapillicoccus sp.]
MSDRTTIRVGAGSGSYPVVVGHGLLGEAAPMLGPAVERLLLVHAPTLGGRAAELAAALRSNGIDVVVADVPDAEAAKSVEVAARLWTALGTAGFTRSDAVVGLGGGSVTDLAGFVAATWLRGVRVLQVPTTLLGMVDAAVGGKTGVNTAEGKNLVGSFHPPVGVLCDLEALGTLPPADLAAGMAEVVKCGFIADARILELVEADPAAALDPGGAVLRELVERAVRVKAEVVTADLREADLREILNYGHTFGHAVEHVEGYRWRHGEAVSVGLTYAAELGRLSGHLSAAEVARHRAVLTSLGLPVSYPGERWDGLLAAMRRDKKSRGSLLRFVVLDAIGRPTRLEGPDDAMLREAYACVSG